MGKNTALIMNIPIIPNYHVLIVKVIGQTNANPARVKIISERFNQSITIPFTNHPGASSPAVDTALLYIAKRGWEIIGKGEGKGHTYLITNTKGDSFEPLKPLK